MWLFPGDADVYFSGAVLVRSSARAYARWDAAGFPKGVQSESEGIIESKLPGSAEQSHVPEACPAPRSSLWLASRGEKPRERAERPCLLCFPFPSAPRVQVDLIKWTGTVHRRRRFPALIK